MKKYHLLIDGDAIVYQAAAHLSVWAVEKDGVTFFFNTKKDALLYADKLGSAAVDKTGTYSACKEIVFDKAIGFIEEIVEHWTKRGDKPTFDVFLSPDNSKENFRYTIFPDYKINRSGLEQPEHFTATREMMKVKYDAIVAKGCEADDAIATAHTQPHERTTVICSRDKDFLTVPGVFFNHYNKTLHIISDIEAERFFYEQILMGDKADGIKGLPGIGPVKARKLLQDYECPKQICKRVLNSYQKHYGADGIEHMTLAGQLLRLRRSEDEPLWQIPLFSEKKS